jgi:hypothetical protein
LGDPQIPDPDNAGEGKTSRRFFSSKPGFKKADHQLENFPREIASLDSPIEVREGLEGSTRDGRGVDWVVRIERHGSRR